MGYSNYVVPVTTTGSAGSATGTAKLNIVGYIESIKVTYHSAPNTTTVDIDEASGMGRKLMDLAAGNTNVVIYPVVNNTNNAGAAVTGIYTRYFVPNTPVTITVAASNALAPAVTVTITAVDH